MATSPLESLEDCPNMGRPAARTPAPIAATPSPFVMKERRFVALCVFSRPFVIYC
jgi:hypothetical protein